MNVIFEPISVYSTPRKCSHIEYNGTDSLGCLQPASFWRFTLDTFGYADKSSRRPVCLVHKDEEVTGRKFREADADNAQTE